MSLEHCSCTRLQELSARHLVTRMTPNPLWHKEILERFTLAEIKWMPGNDNPHFDGVVLRLTDDGRGHPRHHQG